MDLPPPVSTDTHLAEHDQRLDNLEGLLGQVGDDLYSTRLTHGERLNFLEDELLQSARDLRDLGQAAEHDLMHHQHWNLEQVQLLQRITQSHQEVLEGQQRRLGMIMMAMIIAMSGAIIQFIALVLR